MAQSDRLFTADVSVFSVGGTSYLAFLRGATVRRKCSTKENRAAKDTDEYPVPSVTEWSVEASIAVETNGKLLQYAGQAVAVLLKEVGTGLQYSGTGVVSEADHEFSEGSEGVQTERLTIMGQGALSHT